MTREEASRAPRTDALVQELSKAHYGETPAQRSSRVEDALIGLCIELESAQEDQENLHIAVYGRRLLKEVAQRLHKAEDLWALPTHAEAVADLDEKRLALNLCPRCGKLTNLDGSCPDEP